MAIDKKLIDQLLTDYKKPADIIGENGLLKELTKAILETHTSFAFLQGRSETPYFPSPVRIVTDSAGS